MKILQEIFNAGPFTWILVTVFGGALSGANLPHYYEKRSFFGVVRLVLYCSGRFILAATLTSFVGIYIAAIFLILFRVVYAPLILLLIILSIFIWAFSPMLTAFIEKPNQEFNEFSELSLDENRLVSEELVSEKQDATSFVSHV